MYLRIYISNIDASFMMEEYCVTIAMGKYTYIKFFTLKQRVLCHHSDGKVYIYRILHSETKSIVSP